MTIRALHTAMAGAGMALSLLAAVPAAADVLVFAAASTTNVLLEIGDLAARRGLSRVVPSFASSSALARQIADGAPADIYVSANVRWMDFLDRKNAIDRNSKIDLAGNALVLIAPKGGRFAALPAGAEVGGKHPFLADPAGGWLAMGDPDHVPAGLYGRQALIALGLWPAVEKRVARAANARAALVLVERGEAEAGVVYATDAAQAAGKVAVIGVFPEGSHQPIIYRAAILAGRDREEVRRVYALLASAEAAAVFARHGFKPLAAKP